MIGERRYRKSPNRFDVREPFQASCSNAEDRPKMGKQMTKVPRRTCHQGQDRRGPAPAPKAPENFLDHALLSLSHALLCSVKALLLDGANTFLSPVKTQTEKDERNKSITNQG